MHGVIISTGQWPRTGWKRTVPPVLRRGPLAWADVPGVTYPAPPEPPACTPVPAVRREVKKRPDPARWMTCEEARRHLGYASLAGCRSRLAKEGVSTCAYTPTSGRNKGTTKHFWLRSQVEKLAAAKKYKTKRTKR